jgi:DNA modification methylase
MGYEYTGVEIREEEVESINDRKKELNLKYKIICDDAANVIMPDAFDFSVTCPPYYDLEQYDGGTNDLSMAETYPKFLRMLKSIIENTYDSLKNNTFSVWVVNNFRNKNGDLIHFNGDLVRIAEETGFRLYDEIIVNSYSNIAKTRAKQFRVSKKMVRFHEYVLVFRK